MSRQRNFQDEYRRRIERAERSGLSRSQARGHARVGEPAIQSGRAVTPKDSDRFEAALKLYRKSGDQAASAKAFHLAPERLRKFLRESVR